MIVDTEPKVTQKHFTLDYKVNISLILAFLGQVVYFTWYLSGQDKEIQYQGVRIARLESNDGDNTKLTLALLDRLTRLEERQTAQVVLLQEVRDELQRIRVMQLP